MGASLSALFVLFGAFSILSQTVILREYLVAYGGSEIALGLFFSSWLFWIGAGAVAAGRIARRIRPETLFLPAALAYALSPAVQIVLVRSIRLIAGVPPAEPFPLGRLLLVTFLANMPLSALTGALFTLGAAIAAAGGRGDRAGGRGYLKEALGGRAGGAAAPPGGGGAAPAAAGGRADRAVGRVYLMEALGGLAGGAAATWLFSAGVPSARIAAGAGAVLALGVLAASLARRRWVATAAGAAALAGIVAAGPASRAIEAALAAQRWRATLPAAVLVETFDTAYRSVAFGRLGDQRIVVLDGRVAAAMPEGMEAAGDAALAMSESRGARRVLAIGLVETGLLREILAYGVERVVLVEQDGAMLERLRTFLPEEDRKALEDPRVEVIEADPRTWVGRTDETFDLAVVRLPDPDTALMNRLYTVEFFESVRARLGAGGVLATRVTSAENYLGTHVERYARSVVLSLRTVFAEVVVTPGERSLLFASSLPGVVTYDAGELGRRLERIRPPGSAFRPEMLHSIMEPGRVAFVRSVYEREPGPDEPPSVNTDARPVAYLGQILVLARSLGSAVPEVVDALRAAGIWIALVPLAVVLALRARHLVLFPAERGPGVFNAGALAGAAGFVSISIDIVLLHAFQSRHGTLMLEVGLMNALFMAGLAAGAFAIRPALDSARLRRGAILSVTAGLGIAAALLARLTALPLPGTAFAALFLGCGLLGGAAFPAAGAMNPTAGGGALASLLESADSWGGAVGGLVAGVVLIPILGTGETCLVLAAVAAGTLALVACGLANEARSGRRGLAGRLALLARQACGRGSFPWHGTSAVLAGVVLASCALGWIVRSRTERPRVDLTEAQIRSMAGDEGAGRRGRPFVHYALDPAPGGTGGGILLSSMAVAADVKGYGGPLNILVLVRPDGTVGRVRLLESRETPAYVEGIGPWLESSFEGRSAARDFFLRSGRNDRPGDDHGVDALTGATVTARAAVETVNRAKNEAARVLGIEVEEAPPAPWWPRLVRPELIYLVAAFVLGLGLYLWGRPPGGPWPRRALLAANLALGGFVYNAQLSMDHVVRVLGLDLPAPSNTDLFVLVAGAAVLAVLLGPIYCASICPFGAAQEIASLAGLCVRPSPSVERRMRYVRYVAFAAFVSCWMLTGAGSILAADPLQHAFSGRLASGGMMLAGAALVLSLFSFRFWCRTFCPVGALLGLAGRLGIALGLAPAKRYDLCDLGAVRDRDTECLHCNRCLTSTTLTHEKLEPRLVRFPRRSIDLWARVAVLAMALGLGWIALTSTPIAPAASTPTTGTPRDVDIGLVRRLIEEGKLSAKEALYWKPVDRGTATTGIPEADAGTGTGSTEGGSRATDSEE